MLPLRSAGLVVYLALLCFFSLVLCRLVRPRLLQVVSYATAHPLPLRSSTWAAAHPAQQVFLWSPASLCCHCDTSIKSGVLTSNLHATRSTGCSSSAGSSRCKAARSRDVLPAAGATTLRGQHAALVLAPACCAGTGSRRISVRPEASLAITGHKVQLLTRRGTPCPQAKASWNPVEVVKREQGVQSIRYREAGVHDPKPNTLALMPIITTCILPRNASPDSDSTLLFLPCLCVCGSSSSCSSTLWCASEASFCACALQACPGAA